MNFDLNRKQKQNRKQRRSKSGKRVFCLLLAAVLLLTLCPAGFAAEKTVRIGTVRELEDLAKRCSYDRYSKGLKVILTADLDLAHEEVSIPIFLGTFEGGGHKISGLRMTSANSRLGLFGRVEQGAVVRDLQLEGEVLPDGTRSRIGGLAGENRGRLENCSFSGVVSADEQVGGIAGVNEAGGVIENCHVSGVVRRHRGGYQSGRAGSCQRQCL